MKPINSFINEKLKINKDIKFNKYHYFPKTKKELKELIEQLVKKRGNEADLNDINTSEIKDMSSLFYESNFNGNISEWDVSNVKNMAFMFKRSEFNGDISNWDVSNVIDLSFMFEHSNFNNDISKWNLKNAKHRDGMFYECSILKKYKPSWHKK